MPYHLLLLALHPDRDKLNSRAPEILMVRHPERARDASAPR
jgi:hypothetical protein